MTSQTQPKYHLGANGDFIIEDYNNAKPFASFFPGIAGAHGIPMWVFYVNRGQCICSVGLSDKDHPIMEFLSANRAFQLTSTQCFRTFLKFSSGNQVEYYEPFQTQVTSLNMKRSQRMIIYPAQLTIEEVNETLGFKFSVDYFNVPEDNYAGLVRVLRIENLNEKPVSIELLDGLPLIVPCGVDNYNLKNMRRLVESFVEVINCDTRVPYFKGRVKQEDRPEVIKIREGHFYAGFVENRGKSTLVDTIVDPQKVFGRLTDYSFPVRFIEDTPFKVRGPQMQENCLPCAMGLSKASIGAGKTYTYYSIIGHSKTVEELNRMIPRITRVSYVEKKQKENADLIDQLTQNSLVLSNSKKFDLYSRQNFLDNVLRGGFPYSYNGGKGKSTALHLFSRKHGDLERDYNDYRLSPTPYSQGNGNFRDINQNRRSDLFFNPDVREDNVEHFFNLIQLDGFNPLGVKITSFNIKDRKGLQEILKKAVPAKHIEQVKELLSHRFTPGEFFSKLADAKIELKIDQDAFLGELLAISEKHQETDYGHGYWSDHWTYNLDLLENYLGIYPENLRKIFFDNKKFTFFDNIHRVRPRADKYVVWEGHPMQLGAVYADHDKEKQIKKRDGSPYEVRTQFGKGEIYYTNLATKLLCLAVNKLASLDPAGVGIEMESDKPNWYDALNGLPGQLGSSLSETLELKRTILFLTKTFDDLQLKDNDKWAIPVEIRGFMIRVHDLLRKYFADRGADRDFAFWDEASSVKESYRDQTWMGLSGREETVSVGWLKNFFQLALQKIERGIQKAKRKDGNLSTYFMSKPAKYELITVSRNGKKEVKHNAAGQPCFRPLKFKHEALPLFLEGPVHYLRIERDPAEAKRLAKAIRESGLFDQKLKMYKVNESLVDQPMEIGRTRIFSRGWLENESIWMHMEYKYLLELLRCGLHDEFFRDFKSMLVPFLDPEMYGRSILENSSFICSSGNPDASIHGNGFVARLSGSTAEFIHILGMMSFGANPFGVNEKGQLELRLQPTLPGWLFTEKEMTASLWQGDRRKEQRFAAGTFSFAFLGNILVTYHNAQRKDTFGKNGVSPKAFKVVGLDGQITRIEGGAIAGPLAQQIRNRQVSRIEVEMG
ncbi:MAG TPA: hypothetical protein DCZ95_18665 [Verrucomicrobia bacterium]|nr:MAG: hypothetical protein A2X46_15025 [Lentisphaerae bacterium GWF2_57_35]HBA86112.1 hypothetical protein [Verrucomicrobiota bacterium]